MAFSAMIKLSIFNAPQYWGHSFNLTVRACSCSHCVCQTEVSKKGFKWPFLDHKRAPSGELSVILNQKNLMFCLCFD